MSLASLFFLVGLRFFVKVGDVHGADSVEITLCFCLLNSSTADGKSSLSVREFEQMNKRLLTFSVSYLVRRSVIIFSLSENKRSTEPMSSLF